MFYVLSRLRSPVAVAVAVAVAQLVTSIVIRLSSFKPEDLNRTPKRAAQPIDVIQ